MDQKSSLMDMLTDEIKDLYSAEKQLLKAIPKMVKASQHDELRAAFEGHLGETERQVERLEKVGEMLDIKPSGKKCKGMEGVIEEGGEAAKEEGDKAVTDLLLIGAGSRVEHYEMAGYMTAIAACRQLGHAKAASLLEESLAEEQAAEKKLRTIASQLLAMAPPN